MDRRKTQVPSPLSENIAAPEGVEPINVHRRSRDPPSRSSSDSLDYRKSSG
jgi:hypothetical protein